MSQVIKSKRPCVVHVYDPRLALNPNKSYYVGRPKMAPNGNHFGNPFSHLPYSKAEVHVESIHEAVLNYAYWLMQMKYKEVSPIRRQWIYQNLEFLIGKRLACFCADTKHSIDDVEYYPLCHASVLKIMVEVKCLGMDVKFSRIPELFKFRKTF